VDAFNALFEKVSVEYPFTEEKNVDWEALHDEYLPRVEAASSDADFYQAIHDFAYSIPDGHIGGLFNRDVFFASYGGGFGLLIAELSNGRVIVTDVLPGTPGESAGIQRGAEIIEWDGQPVTQAINEVDPRVFGSYATEQARRQDQLIFLTRVPSGTRVDVRFQNPGGSPQEVTMAAADEVDSLLQALFPPSEALNLPVEGRALESGLGYVRISSFSDDFNLTARLWERYVQQLVDNQVLGLIIDLRSNGGGSGGLALDFAGFFFDEEFVLAQNSYYNEGTGAFEYEDPPTRVRPAPTLYEGPIAILVSPSCVSACEYFAYTMAQGDRSIVVGNFPTAGAAGEVGRGQYSLPGDLDLQFPTGRPETPDGDLLIEGTGVPLDVTVPVTEEQVLDQGDPVLDAAVEALLDQIGN
jgi:carboxyl-terminal processing protease